MKISLLLSLAVVFGYTNALGRKSNYGLFLFGLDGLEDSKEEEVKEDPKPCCLPETWQGFVHTVFGSAGTRQRTVGTLTSTKVYMDGTKKRIAGNIYTGCKKCDTTFIGLYNTSGKGFQLYAFKSVNATTCWSHYYESLEYQKPCLPSNSTFLGQFTVGLAGKGIPVNSWSVRAQLPGVSFSVSIIVTPDSCVPIAFGELGSIGGRPRPDEEDDEKGDDDVVGELPGKSSWPRNGRLLFEPHADTKPGPRHQRSKFVVGSVYSDVELQIKDAKVFDLPDICKKNPQSYPSNLDEVADPNTREGFENLEAILEHVIV